MNERYQYLVDMVNERGLEYTSQHFADDIEKVLSFLTRKKLWSYIELDNIEDEYQQNVMNILLSENPQQLYKYVMNSFHDVKFDGKDYFLEIRDREDLAEWFKGAIWRDTSPQDIAKRILADDYDSDYYYLERKYVDIMREVYDQLNDQNKKKLRDIIVSNYSGDTIGIPSEDVTDVIERIGTQDDDGDYEFVVTQEIMMDLFSDDETMDYLFKEYFNNEYDNLFSLYSSSYNSADYEEYENKIWGELHGSFIDSDAVITYKTFGKREYIELKITNVFPGLVSQYFKGYCEELMNIGGYLEFIKEGINCDSWEALTFRIDDYPDSRLVKKHMNDSFNDYF